MTAKKYTYILFFGSLLLLLLVLLPGMHAAEATKAALLLCARSLVPALLVPLVLSGILSALSTAISLPGERLFARFFHLPPQGLSPFLLGALCGFPIGAKVTAELHAQNLYDKRDAARIAALSANTGPAFAVAGVGIAFFGDARLGWIFYLIQIMTAVFWGRLDARRHPLTANISQNKNKTLHFSLPDILYRASLSLLTITGTIAFFGTLCALPARFLPKSATAALGAILEVGTGTYHASLIPYRIGIPLASFAISFSGISVLLQNAAHLAPQGIALAPLVYRKLLQGILAMLLTLLLLPLL